MLVFLHATHFTQVLHLELELVVKYYIRYADDFVIFSDDKTFLEGLITPIAFFLREHLHLGLHPDKVFIKTIASGVDFLGWVLFPNHRVLRTSTEKRMFRTLENNPGPEVSSSYLGLLKHGNTYKLQEKVAEIINN